MRKDAVELETDFEQMVQLSLATASAIALAPVAISTISPELLLLPYVGFYTNPDKLKRADALLIAMMSERRKLGCAPYPRCRIADDESGTLHKLRNIREMVDSREMPEQQGISELTSLLDKLCTEGIAAAND